jgi:Dolichyl-phosphate-mannose-protein mannosyltransferase
VTEVPRTISKNLVWALLACLVVYAIARSVAAAAGKRFWYDELLTLTVSSLGSWNDRLSALKLPLDGQPPLFYTIEHFALGLTRNKEIALRVPSILAFPCALVCIFVYVRKRGGEVLALVCAAFLLITAAFDTYAVEARPYSMVLACIAFALVCYQRAPARLWTLLLAASLALAELLHYMAVVSMVPFGLAEVVVLIQTRRVRWPVWASLLAGAAPLFLQWKLIATNKEYYGPRFWAHFSFSNLPRTYAEYLGTHSPVGGGVAALALGAVALTYFWPRGDEEERIHGRERGAEAMLLLGLVSLPFIAYVLVILVMNSGLTARYVLATVLGLLLTMGFALARASWKAVALSAAFVFAAVGVQELSFWRAIKANIHETTSHGIDVQNFVDRIGHPELPVAIANPFVYLAVVHYCAPALVDRVRFVVPEPERNKDLPDTAAKGMVLLQSYWPVRVNDLREFTSLHQEFLVYIEDVGSGRDWLIERLAEDGWSPRPIEFENYRIIYLVRRDGSAPTK